MSTVAANFVSNSEISKDVIGFTPLLPWITRARRRARGVRRRVVDGHRDRRSFAVRLERPAVVAARQAAILL